MIQDEKLKKGERHYVAGYLLVIIIIIIIIITIIATTIILNYEKSMGGLAQPKTAPVFPR